MGATLFEDYFFSKLPIYYQVRANPLEDTKSDTAPQLRIYPNFEMSSVTLVYEWTP